MYLHFWSNVFSAVYDTALFLCLKLCLCLKVINNTDQIDSTDKIGGTEGMAASADSGAK